MNIFHVHRAALGVTPKAEACLLPEVRLHRRAVHLEGAHLRLVHLPTTPIHPPPPALPPQWGSTVLPRAPLGGSSTHSPTCTTGLVLTPLTLTTSHLVTVHRQDREIIPSRPIPTKDHPSPQADNTIPTSAHPLSPPNIIPPTNQFLLVRKIACSASCLLCFHSFITFDSSDFRSAFTSRTTSKRVWDAWTNA